MAKKNLKYSYFYYSLNILKNIQILQKNVMQVLIRPTYVFKTF